LKNTEKKGLSLSLNPYSMNKQTKKIASITLGITYALLLLNVVFMVYKAFGLLFSLLFMIAGIVIPPIVIFGKKKLDKCMWYKEMTDKQYQKFLVAYTSYRNEILKAGNSYDIFFTDFCNSNSYIVVPTDSGGNILVDELNKANLYLGRVLNLLQNRKDLVEEYFTKDSFDYCDYLSMIEAFKATTFLPTNSTFYNITDEIVSNKVKEFILKCYEPGGTMSLGDRNFGYYIKHRHSELSSAKQYAEAWNKYIGKFEPRDNCKYISDPSYWKNPTEISATLKALEKIEAFYLSLMQDNSPIIKNIQKDKIELEKNINPSS
jgi:predicted membrane protein